MSERDRAKREIDQLNKYLDFESVNHFTSIHKLRNAYLDPQFDHDTSFADKMLLLVKGKMMLKIALITFASAGFGIFMGLLMSSFEFN